MKWKLIWRLSGEAPLYLSEGNLWTDNVLDALVFYNRTIADNLARHIGHDVRVCI
jgi:hypothetical protein